MGISKGVRKAAQAANVQSRGLEGKRNSQGDFAQAMPEDVQTKGVQDAVNPDIQNYIDDVRKQIDEVDAELGKLDYNVDTPGLFEEGTRLENKKIDLIKDAIDRLESEGIEIPEELYVMLEVTG